MTIENDFMLVSEANEEVIDRLIREQRLDAKEPNFGQTVLHLLLANFVLHLSDAGQRDETWLADIKKFATQIIKVVTANPRLLDIADDEGVRPIVRMSSWCPVFARKPEKETEMKAIDLIKTTAKQLLSYSNSPEASDKDKEAVVKIESQLSFG